MAATAYKSTADVDIDVGILYAAPIGTTEPTSATSVLDAAWREIGYTEDGSKISTAITTADLEVAELLDPISVKTTKRTTKVMFSMAQATRSNLMLALNQGAAATDTTTAVAPVDLASEVRVMLLWESEQTGTSQRRWLFRQCYNTGSLDIANAKSPQKRLLGVEFSCEKPESSAVFTVFPSADGEI